MLTFKVQIFKTWDDFLEKEKYLSFADERYLRYSLKHLETSDS